MLLKKIIAFALTAAVMPCAYAAEDGLFSGKYTPESFVSDAENGVTFETEVPDGDYIVTVKTGGNTETKANVYINGGERVRAYTLEAGKTQDNEQPAVPKDGKISVQVLGENPNVTEIDIQEIPARTEPGEKLTVYIAGDSTAQTYDYTKVFPQTGWGQVFGDYFTDDVVIQNRSMGGRSSKSYDNDGRLDKILTEMHPGDYVFIQFGINDGNVNKPERYISVEDYKTLITEKYIGEVKKRGGIPVLLTASAASWWDEEKECFMESRQDYAVPTKEIAKETGTALIDICDVMTKKWNEMEQDDVFGLYFICELLESKAYPTGTDDHTHLKAAGAKVIAGLIADEVEKNIEGLAPYIKKPAEFTDIKGHWAEKTITDMRDYIEGVGGDKFEPDRSVSRAEFLKMAMDAAGIAPHAYREGECLDASNDDWYCYYLQGALDKDIIPETMINGCKKETVTKTLAEATEKAEAVTTEVNVYTGSFNGDAAITREEMAEIAVNCILDPTEEQQRRLTAEMSMSSIPFRDTSSLAAIEAYALGLVDGREGQERCNILFMPDENLTRAEAVTVAQRIINPVK